MKISKLIKKLIFTIVILIFLALLAVGGYMTYVDSNSTKARQYLLDKYEIDDKDWLAFKYTEYVYEDIANCNTLWLKKCTDDKSLAFKYTFINKNKDKINVYEDIDGNYTDDYDGTLKDIKKNYTDDDIEASKYIESNDNNETLNDKNDDNISSIDNDNIVSNNTDLVEYN